MTASRPPSAVLTVVVMGVAGSGKTTVGRLLAARLGRPFVEGDDLHPAANVAKMRSGQPLDDADRRPWLEAVAGRIGTHERRGQDVVVSCSALRRRYRDLLRTEHPSVEFVQLDVDPLVLRRRLESRRGHFLPASLLASQLASLEPLAPDEPGMVLRADAEPHQVVEGIAARLAAVRWERAASRPAAGVPSVTDG